MNSLTNAPPSTTGTTPGYEPDIDQLIPPSRSPVVRFVAGLLIVGIAVALAVGFIGGFLVPRPLGGGMSATGEHFSLDTSTGLIKSRVGLPNFSSRDLRAVEVSLDAPGVTLVRSEVVIEDFSNVESSIDASGAQVAEWSGDQGDPDFNGPIETRLELPAMIGAGHRAALDVWFEIDDCVELTSDWGYVDVTYDFGDGAFPNISKTVRMESDPLWDSSMFEYTGGLDVDGNFVQSEQPLQLACELLG